MTSKRTTHWCCVAVLALACAVPAFAAEPEKAPSPEAREKMAAVHQKMAECLRSSRPMSECRAEMTASCKEMMGDGGCPMMGGGPGGMGPGMMQHGKDGGMMKGPPPPPAPEKK